MSHRLAQWGLLPLSLLLIGSSHADLSQRDDVHAFVEEMSERHDFDRERLGSLFREVELRQDIISAISRPAEAKPWYKYRPIFLTESRIQQGVEFWSQHAGTLARAEAEYGVDPAVIVAIIGVETRYGQHQGSYRVMDSLSTLAFGYPPRAPFFRRQLEEFLLMAREERVDPLEFSGSYAGAMGQPQFIPSSFRAYAVDFDRDGRRDLWGNVEDVVGSVANYFARHRWQPGAPVAAPARVSGTEYRKLAEKGYRPNTPVAQLASYGVTAQAAFAPTAEAALVALETEQGEEHWVALHNFYVITRYNHSPLYAMAVYQLSQAIRERYTKEELADAG